MIDYVYFLIYIFLYLGFVKKITDSIVKSSDKLFNDSSNFEGRNIGSKGLEKLKKKAKKSKKFMVQDPVFSNNFFTWSDCWLIFIYGDVTYPFGVRPVSFLYTSFPFTFPVIKQVVFLLSLLFWLSRDSILLVLSRYDRRIHLYGIWCFVGLPGAGKTMSLVYYLDSQRRKYGSKILICTNFYYSGQDFHLSNWEILLQDYDRPVIFAWDELQNEFNSREYRNFPLRLVHELTQNRKGHGKQVVYTTQTFGAVDNNFRNLTTQVVDCRTYFGRLTSCRYFKTQFYEAFNESKSIDKKIKIKPMFVHRFIQTDYMRSRYDSFQRLDYLKNLAISESEDDQVRARRQERSLRSSPARALSVNK